MRLLLMFLLMFSFLVSCQDQSVEKSEVKVDVDQGMVHPPPEEWKPTCYGPQAAIRFAPENVPIRILIEKKERSLLTLVHPALRRAFYACYRHRIEDGYNRRA